MKEQEIEWQLWDYIDGTCNADDNARITKLIATDARWKAIYHELSELHVSVLGTDTEQPSMRFTKNVMESIAHASIARASRTYISPAIIRGIAALFIFIIVGCIAYGISIASWQPSSVDSFDFSAMFSSTWFMALAWINVILALLFIDTLLRRKSLRHQQK